MQFIEDGPDIPDKLITARDKGEVIFICGAGISMPAGLPNFKGLVEKIYEELGEEKEGREKDTFEEKKYDQTLWLLEKRLTGGSNRIRNAVNEILDKQIDYFDLHQALLILSQNSNQKSCLITTNFDICFEQIDNSAQSYSAPNLPIFPPDHGIIHIHGKLREKLILTFADIADAYLQSGWAKQFLNRLARWKRIIFVGYSGNDPFFQLLMAAVSEDRQWAQDIPLAYAFVEKGTEDLWQAFDIKTIPYKQDNHDLLHKSLIEWAKYAEDIETWRDKKLRHLMSQNPDEKLRHLMSQNPDEQSDFEKSQFKSLITQTKTIPDGANPSSAWWKVVKGLQLAPYSIIPWISQNLEQPDMVRAFVAHPPEDMNLISSLGREIGKEEKLQEPFRKAWKLILYAEKNRPRHEFEQLEPWFSFQDRIKNNDYGQEVREGIVNAISPRLKVGISRKGLEEEIEGKQEEQPQTITLYDLMRPEFETNHFIHTKDILKFWQPEDKELTFKLCRDLTNSMVEKLEFAKENDLEWSAVLDVPSIELHEQNSDHASDFYPIVRLTVDLWERLDKDEAIKIANMWNDNRKLILMHRMYLHALTKETLYGGMKAASELLNLGDDFWGSDKRKEIATLLQKRWQDFTENRLEKLEKKILAGPLRKLYRDDLSEKDWKKRKEFEILKKLRAISIEEGRPSPEVQKIFDKLKKKYPDLLEWQTEFNSYHQSFSGEQGDPSLLEKIPPEDRVDKALELQNQSFEQHHVWRKYCSSNPKGALEALKAKAESKKEWPEWAWQQFFWGSESWKNFNLDNESERNLIADVLETIKSIPERNLEPFVDSASFWMREIMHLFDEEQKLCLWHKLMDALEHRDKKNDKQRNRADPFTDAINRAEGRLTEMVFSWWKQRGENEGFEEKITPLMERLVKCKNYSGALIRTTMMPRLDYLYYIAPAWTEKNILSELKEESPMWWPLWDGYKYNNNLPAARLFNTLKPAMLAVIESSEQILTQDPVNPHITYDVADDNRIKNRLTWLSILLLLYREQQDYDLTAREMRQILRKVDDDTRCYVLGNLRIQLRNKLKEEKEQKIKHIFSKIWPLDANFITEGVLSKIISLIVDMGDAFPQSLQTVKGFLRPHGSDYFLGNLARDSGEKIYIPQKFPEDTLELLDLTIDSETPPFHGLNAVLHAIKQSKPELESDHRFRKLRNFNS